VQIRSASGRTVSRNEIATRRRLHAGNQGLLRHDLVPSHSKQDIDISVRIPESRSSEPKARVDVKMPHGVFPFVWLDWGPRGLVSRARDKVHD
jgi:hypothetical protein